MSVGSRVSFSSHALQAPAGGGHALGVPGSGPRSAKKLRLELEEEEQYKRDIQESRDKHIHVTIAESAKSKDAMKDANQELVAEALEKNVAGYVGIDKNTKDILDRSAMRHNDQLEEAKNRRISIKHALVDAEYESEEEQEANV